jgi:hypothetical protein
MSQHSRISVPTPRPNRAVPQAATPATTGQPATTIALTLTLAFLGASLVTRWVLLGLIWAPFLALAVLSAAVALACAIGHTRRR